jgi:hypothetical protein
MINISKTDGVGDGGIREYSLRNPRTLVYSEPRFLKLVSGQLGARCHWIVARREGLITGLLPFLVKEGPLGPSFNSLAYYGSNGGVIQAENDVASKVALVDSFYEMATDAKAVSATIIINPLEGDSEFYNSHVVHDFRDERIGQITHFPARAEDLLGSFDDPRPRNIRRAIKEGVTVVRGGLEALDFLYSTHVDNMTAIGGIAKKRAFFDAIPATMEADDWAVFTASLDGKPIAALLLFYFNRTVEYFTPVIVESHRNTQALALVIYEAMRDAMQRGFTNWNWGGTWLSQGGVYDFKKRWGTSEYQYFYYTRVINTELTSCEPAFLMEHYPGFFLIPFNRLTRR